MFKLLLSKEACVMLGIVSETFPAVGSSMEKQLVFAEISVGLSLDQNLNLEPCTVEDDGSCRCPRRESVLEPHNLIPSCQYHSFGRGSLNTMHHQLSTSVPDRPYS